MPSILDQTLFSEPSGRTTALVQFGAAVCFSAMYLYFWTVGEASSGKWLLFMVAGTALAGVAESLPTNRRRAAGALRVAGILLLLVVVAEPFFGFGLAA